MSASLQTPFYDLQELLLQTKTSVGHVKLSLMILRSYRFPQNNLLSERPAKNSTESILRPRSRAEFIIKYAWYFNVKHDTQPRENLRNMSYLQYNLIWNACIWELVPGFVGRMVKGKKPFIWTDRICLATNISMQSSIICALLERACYK